MNKNIIIPEVVNTQPKESIPRDSNVNINLTKSDNRRKYEIHNIHTISNSTVNNNYNQGISFIRFVFSVLFLPFVLIYKLFRYIFTRFNLYERLKIEYKQNKFKSKMRSWTKKHRDIYNLDEVY